MAGKVGLSSDISFALQTERELASVVRKLSGIEAGATDKCSRERELWKRFATLSGEYAFRREIAGRRYFDHGARDNLEKMGSTLRRIHEMCKKVG